MKIRKATEKDFDRIMEIYAIAREYMAANGNPMQWGPNSWPPAELIENDIRVGKSYVCTTEIKENDNSKDSEEVIGVFYYDYGENIEGTYNNIEGKWIGSNEYGVVHRLAGDGSVKGIGACCLNWAFEQHGHVRVDTHGDNKTMQNLLTKLGFKECGIIHVTQDPYPRIAYEKLV